MSEWAIDPTTELNNAASTTLEQERHSVNSTNMMSMHFDGKGRECVLTVFRKQTSRQKIFFPPAKWHDKVWWIWLKMDEHSSAALLSAPLCCSAQYSSGGTILTHPKNQKGRQEEGGMRFLRDEKKIFVSLRDACPGGIKGTLPHQTEEVILPAGQFENNQPELSRCSF